MPDDLYELVAWGEHECRRKGCGRPAELLYDSEPVCIPCADELLERQIAIAQNPALRELLPEWGG